MQVCKNIPSMQVFSEFFVVQIRTFSEKQLLSGKSKPLKVEGLVASGELGSLIPYTLYLIPYTLYLQPTSH